MILYVVGKPGKREEEGEEAAAEEGQKRRKGEKNITGGI